MKATQPHPRHPTLPLLTALGYTPLSHDDALHHRSGRLRTVVLHDILADRLLAINRFTYRGHRYRFDLEDAHEAIRHLHPTPDRIRDLHRTNQHIYDLLVRGTTITQNIAGDARSYPFRYIDWDDPTNNVYHVTADMEVERTGSFKTRRLDVVAFVNGIPFIVIEDKRTTEGGPQAGTQLIDYQRRENIPHLFHFAQLLLALNRTDVRYATVGTPKKFWQGWREPSPENESSEQQAVARAAADTPTPPPPKTTSSTPSAAPTASSTSSAASPSSTPASARSPATNNSSPFTTPSSA